MSGKRARALRKLAGFDVRAPKKYVEGKRVGKVAMRGPCVNAVPEFRSYKLLKRRTSRKEWRVTGAQVLEASR